MLEGLLEGLGIPYAKNIYNRADQIKSLVTISKEIKEREGFVVTFTDGLQVKLKSDWYMERHGLFTEDIYKENFLIRVIIENELDDVLRHFEEKDERRIYAISVQKKITNWLWKTVEDVHKVASTYGDYADKKSFFMAVKDHKHRSLILETSKKQPVNEEIVFQVVKNYLLRTTLKLENARTFLEGIENDDN